MMQGNDTITDTGDISVFFTRRQPRRIQKQIEKLGSSIEASERNRVTRSDGRLCCDNRPDPIFFKLMAKITLREDPAFTKQYPAKWNCRLVAETSAGARHEGHIAYPKGHPENPFSDAEVEEKFLRLAEPSLGRTRCKKFIDWAWRLEQAENIGELFPLLAIS